LKKIRISKYHKFAFSGQISLKIIVELLKNAPMLIKRHLPFWQVLPIDSGFKSYLSRVLPWGPLQRCDGVALFRHQANINFKK